MEYIEKLIEDKKLDEITYEEEKITDIIKLYENYILQSLNGVYVQNQITRCKQIIEKEKNTLNYIREKKEELLNALIESKDEEKINL